MNRRAPLFAAIGSGVVVVLAIFFLVLPKQAAIRDAQGQLEEARAEQSRLQAQLASLLEAQANAALFEQQIRELEAQVPPVADIPGLVNLITNVARQDGVDPFAISPGAPSPDATNTFSVITVDITVKGEFFALEEFLFDLETLSRAAKVTTVSASGQQTGLGGSINMQLSVEFYTTDLSAGPGSEPGPTETAAGAAVAPVAPPTPET